MPDNVVNFAYTTVTTAPSPATSGTTMTVAAGTNLPTAPFNMTCWPPNVQPLLSNAEIVRVGARSTNSLTSITRAQQGTSAKSIAVGWQVMCGADVGTLEQYAPSGIASARAFVSGSSQTIANSTTTTINTQTADTTYGNVGITVGASGMTIVTAGKYRISACVEGTFSTAPTVGNGCQLNLTKNGTIFATFSGAIWFFLNEFWTGSGDDVVKCAVGDTIAMSVTNLSGQTISIESGTNISFLSAVLEAQ